MSSGIQREAEPKTEKSLQQWKSCFREARELYLGTSVPELCSAPSPLEFHRFVTFSPLLSKSVFLNLHHHLQIRDWVSPNLPVVIRGGASHFPAIDSWTPQLLRSRIGQAKVTVAVTPDGLADAPKVGVFFSSVSSVFYNMIQRHWVFSLPSKSKVRVTSLSCQKRGG